MPIKWKSPDKFKPSYIIDHIASVRTYGEDGKSSYSDLVVDECIPTLHSMLHFPPAAAEIDQETLVWRALNRAGKELTAETFLKAANDELNTRLATKESQYVILTTISFSSNNFIKTTKIFGCEIKFLQRDFPKKFIKNRQNIIKQFTTVTTETPPNYCNILIKARAKSPNVAFHKAMRAIDLTRALMCLMANSRMQITFGRPSHEPINEVRPGSQHTVHFEDGKSARDSYWYEPYFKPKSPYTPDKPEVMSKNIRWALKKIEQSNFGKEITSSLLMFVRGMDLYDHNAAFLKMWGALEALTTPKIADYDKLIRRTSFLFKEVEYHRQVLEHLRAYRNANVHIGEESENAKIHCFQLQTYYRAVVWFFIHNAKKFPNLEDIGAFLDSPPDIDILEERLKYLKKAIKFRKPK